MGKGHGGLPFRTERHVWRGILLEVVDLVCSDITLALSQKRFLKGAAGLVTSYLPFPLDNASVTGILVLIDFSCYFWRKIRLPMG